MMRFRRALALALILLTVCLLPLGALAEAPEAAETETTTVEETEAEPELDSETEPEAEPETEPEDPYLQEPELPAADYLKEFGYTDDVLLSGVFATDEFYFQIPSYWTARYAYARIQLTLSQLIGDGPASLTFSVNEQPVYSRALEPAQGREQVLYIPIPLDLLNQGYNRFGVTGYVRIYDNEGCIDDLTSANWVRIAASSFVAVGYDAEDPDNDISRYPYPFASTMDPPGGDTAVAVSDKMEDSELAAALLLRADLSAQTEGRDDIAMTTLTGAEAYPKKVVVSLVKNLSQAVRDRIPRNAGDLADRALLLCYGEGEDRTLLVTSADGDCLMEAARMLVDGSRAAQASGDAFYVQRDASALLLNAAESGDDSQDYTLTVLAGGGLSYVGPFRQEKTVFLPFSGGSVLSGTGTVDLRFRYSENLDFTRSLITVYWGDVPVASKKLAKEAADGDSLRFSLPSDVVGTAAGSIRIVFDLELPDLFCSPRSDEMPWAYVTGDSSFYLPAGKAGSLSFDSRPAPFEQNNRFQALTVVVPDEMTSTELNTLGRIVALYGVNIDAYGSIQAVHAGSFDETADRNLIVLGTYQDNALLRSLNENLSFRYSQDGTRFLGNETQLLDAGFAGRIGVLQLCPSPYGQDRAILAVCATGDETMEQIGSALRKEEGTWSLTGDAVVFSPNGDVSAYTFLKETSVQAPDLKEFVQNNRDTVLFTVVAVSIMGLFLLTVILILIRIYLARKKEH